MSKLKVLFITDWYPNPQRPVEGVFVKEHAKAVARFAEVVVLHSGDATPEIRGLWKVTRETNPEFTQGINTYRVHRHTSLPVLSIALHLGSVLSTYRRIVADGFTPDIIHAHVFYAGLPAVLIGKLYKIPVVITEHSSSFPRKLINRRGIIMARLAFQNADFVLPVSQALQDSIESYGIKAKFRIIPNVVDTSLFYPPTSPKLPSNVKRLLMVALMDASHNKGLPILLQALAQLSPVNGDWHLDLVGDGPARLGYESMVQELGLTDKIAFHGIQPKTKVAEFMRKADFFVLPSLWDNMPCVLIEAQSCGLPIIATRTGGIPEIVSEDTGVLVPPGDSIALHDALLKTLGAENTFNHQAISQKAKRYTLEIVSDMLRHIYEECLQ
ncbi:MAG: glycosyltransferase [Anaerolineae bacterium]|nr:glycosyltransferase [Anaerolineae bacterium]